MSVQSNIYYNNRFWYALIIKLKGIALANCPTWLAIFDNFYSALIPINRIRDVLQTEFRTTNPCNMCSAKNHCNSTPRCSQYKEQNGSYKTKITTHVL